MKLARMTLLTLILAGTALASTAGPELDLPVRLNRLSERVVAAWMGEFAMGNQTIAVASKKGIIIIDTYASRIHGELIRKAVEKEFGRSDYFAVINTHQHYDHTNGNQLYVPLPVIAHQAAREGMRSDVAKIPEWTARVRLAIQGMEEKQRTLDAETREGKTNSENIIYWRTVVQDLGKGHVPSYPNVTFTDRMSLDLGDLTLDLYSFPGLHTKGDILVHIPEEKVLCVGDMINDGWLPPLSKEAATNPAYLLQTWKEVLERGPDIRNVLPGHSYVKVSFESFKWRYDYFKTLWEGLIKAKAAGKSLAEAQTMFAFETTFPNQKDMIRKLPGPAGGQEVDVHAQNIEICG
ncbi:MAG: MBL fold metallo-hydrolase, partial [Candidatus Aminicenantes bacterium]|nr:MBL fold metallo-hydrolase [Candidatus Aminicenantes bacterium]